MEQNQRDVLLKHIQHEIEHLKNEIVVLKEKMQPIAPDCSLGRLTRMEALGEQEINAKILFQSEDRLEKLEYVLRNINSSNYGICRVCDEEIDIERLKILPETTICIECSRE